MALLCTVGHLPDVLLRYVAFAPKMTKKQKAVYCSVFAVILLAMPFVYYAVISGSSDITAGKYKQFVMVFTVAATLIHIFLLPGYFKEHLFTAGVIANIVLGLFAFGTTVSMLIPGESKFNGILIQMISAILLFAVIYVPLKRMLNRCITIFLDLNAKSYWNTVMVIPISLYFSSAFLNDILDYRVTVSSIIGRYLICVTTLFLCWSVARDAENIKAHNEKDIQLALQHQYYRDLTEKVREDREARHDHKHNINAIRGYLANKDYEGLEEFCNAMEHDSSVVIPITGNNALDGVLYHYARLAAENGVKMEFSCDFRRVSVKDFDLCRLLGNALDNAFTAAQQYDGERYIYVMSKTEEDMLMIIVVNSFDGVLKKKNGKILSKKREDEPGIGISSMEQICAKYDGRATFEAEGNRFTARFILNK